MVPMRLCLHHTTLCFVFALEHGASEEVMMQGGILESGAVIRCLKTLDEDIRKDFTQATGRNLVTGL